MAEPRRRMRLHTVRARATAGAVLVVAITLVIGGALFLVGLRLALTSAAASAAESTAEAIAEAVEESGAGALAQFDDDAVVQVIDASGAVLATTEEAEGLNLARESGSLETDDDRYLLMSESVEDTDLVVWIGYEVDTDAVLVVAQLLLIAIPLLVGLVGYITWRVTGAALSPVHKIRSEVDEISALDLGRRVQVPPTKDEIASLAVTMNSMLDRLERGARTQRQFVSDASHELRSPLATIRQHAELAASTPPIISEAEFSEVVLAEGARMQDLVDSLLLLARLDEGAPADWRSVDLDDLALAEVARARAAGVNVDSSGISAAQVVGDARLLSRVARNLIDNAMRHAEQHIAVTVTADASHAIFVVEDDGSGVPESERVRIFERFVRLDESRTRDAGGTGLGLAIVRGIVSAHGGGILVGESRWQGARFTVTLPLQRHEAGAS